MILAKSADLFNSQFGGPHSAATRARRRVSGSRKIGQRKVLRACHGWHFPLAGSEKASLPHGSQPRRAASSGRFVWSGRGGPSNIRPMRGKDPAPLMQGFWAISSGTLASRVLGMLRDTATAGLLGLAAGGVMDAFVLAFRLPNLLRRLFGEGALATSYLPVLSAELERDRERAARLASAVVGRLAAVLGVVLLAGEACCGLAWFWSDAAGWRLLVGLTAAMLPYLWFVCIAAQLSATLEALSRFSLRGPGRRLAQRGLAGRRLVDRAGPVGGQAGSGLRARRLHSGGRRFASRAAAAARRPARFFTPRGPSASRAPLAEDSALASVPWRSRSPSTQVSLLVDSLLAWGLAAPAARPIRWLPGAIAYPLPTGATRPLFITPSAFYQLPVGLLGAAAATVMFPLLSRHAAQGLRGRLAGDLVRGSAWCVSRRCRPPPDWCCSPSRWPDCCSSTRFYRGRRGAHRAIVFAYAPGVWRLLLAAADRRGLLRRLGDARTPLRGADRTHPERGAGRCAGLAAGENAVWRWPRPFPPARRPWCCSPCSRRHRAARLAGVASEHRQDEPRPRH